MFHILIDPTAEFGTGLLRDGNGNPIEFASEQDAVAFLAQGPTGKAKIVSVSKPINLHNPGDIPQVGSANHPVVPGMQVHPASLDFNKVMDAKPVNITVPGTPESIKKAQERDEEGKAKMAGDATPQAIRAERQSDEVVKKADEAKVDLAHTIGTAHNAPKK